jgi:hypothetical protein
MVRKYSEHVSAREYLVSSIRRDIIGPSWNPDTHEPNLEEILELDDSNPTRYYLGGFLEPSNKPRQRVDDLPELIDEENKKGLIDVEDSGQFSYSESTESELLLSPSSLGMTFSTNSKSIDLEINWGTYTNEVSGEWKRAHHIWKEKVILKEGNTEIAPSPDEGLRLLVKVRLFPRKKVITIRLVNDREETDQRNSLALSSIFQPQIIIGCEGDFLDVRSESNLVEDPTMSILYRKSIVKAFGHNIGVNWDDNKVWTEHIPSFEIPRMTSDSSLDDKIPEMDLLCDIKTLDQGLVALENLISEYNNWIISAKKSLEKDIKSGLINRNNNDLTTRVNEHIANAEFCSRRMGDGIRTLRSNDMVRMAFVLANRSIKKSQEGPTGKSGLEEGQFKWRPFQIAFQLLNLNGLISTETGDDYYTERDIIDLAWFPTGGGKTEAYFGLIAIIGFYRRLRYPEKEKNPSVHAIMRYTLRLLTMDQAERLVRLVGAMNEVSKDKKLPASITDAITFRVGMWVGKSASPNRLEGDRMKVDAKSILIASRKGEGRKASSRVIMFDNCPWCDSESIRDANNWHHDAKLNGRNSLRGKCEGNGCIFNSDEGIPFTPIDDDILNNPPSILLATADKFVQVAYNRESSDKYNGGLKQDTRNLLGFNGNQTRPPDLVIQDELHLLTGPLGSLAGLLETAIDVAWKNSLNHRPKYVAATATIRGAERDAKLMFGRDMNIFPPPVNYASDNFFAQESSISEEPGRIHLSILGPPKKSRTLGDQPIASALQSVQELTKKFDESVVDKYWTLVSYYNSLRELGGAQSSLSGRIKSEFIPLFSTDPDFSREISNVKELTSRVSQDTLINTKNSLSMPLDLSSEEAVDVVVTSNLFQVGIDIERLGMMVINGQPKSNSEYIQSSGRVGRKYPGLVISLLRSTFPRDQSHYEMHRAFHQEIYRHVDRTSTTPFSHRALDRALDTTLMALIRLVSPELSYRDSLNQIIDGHDRTVIDPINDAIEDFTKSIENRLEQTSSSNTNDKRYIKEIVREIQKSWNELQHWVRINKLDATCCWTPVKTPKNREISWSRGFDDKSLDAKLVISSLRDVADEIPAARSLAINPGYWVKNFKLPASHLLSHASPGSIWEKNGSSFLTRGINIWQNHDELNPPPMQNPVINGGCLIEEDQLNHSSDLLGSNVDSLRALPTDQRKHGHVSFTPFPLTFYCSDGHLEKVRAENISEGEPTICQRDGCNKHSSQMRFVSICAAGHLHDFNYGWWIQQRNKNGCKCSKHKVDLILGKNHSISLKSWLLKCTNCGATRDMKRAASIGENDRDAMNCGSYGEPWLENDWSERNRCEEKLVHRQIGAASVTYNQRSSIMLIPLDVSWNLANNREVHQYKQESSLEEMKETYNYFKKKGRTENLHIEIEKEGYTAENIDEFFQDLIDYNSNKNKGPLTLSNVRNRERSGMLMQKSKDSRFKITPIDTQKWLQDVDSVAKKLSRIDRLTELSFITGISRILDSNPEITIHESDDNRFGIGSYNFGEGIFIDINPKWLQKQADNRERDLENKSSMNECFEPGRIPRNIRLQIPSLEDPKNRNAFTILHSLSHLIIRQLSKESGYSLGSIRERIYFNSESGKIKQSSLVFYTSGPSSDGTLGGLSSQATIDRIERIINHSVNDSRINCSNDPVCMEHKPLDLEPNGAACHTCLILPESSCECRNYMLDRNWG